MSHHPAPQPFFGFGWKVSEWGSPLVFLVSGRNIRLLTFRLPLNPLECWHDSLSSIRLTTIAYNENRIFVVVVVTNNLTLGYLNCHSWEESNPPGKWSTTWPFGFWYNMSLVGILSHYATIIWSSLIDLVEVHAIGDIYHNYYGQKIGQIYIFNIFMCGETNMNQTYFKRTINEQFIWNDDEFETRNDKIQKTAGNKKGTISGTKAILLFE